MKLFGIGLVVATAIAHPNQGKAGEPCPFLETETFSTERVLAKRTGDGGIPEGGYQAVMEDLKALLTDSQDFFPADFEPPIGPSYGGRFIRLAWHCSGTYRQNDGRGGCDGGRIRFDPERDWMDNASLVEVRQLLEPIKNKYRDALSWGDLMILSGNVALQEMGVELLGFCGGRIDDANGDDSLYLGPSALQEDIAPCDSVGKDGDCLSVEGTALGPTTLGLIYVNPRGPDSEPNVPAASAPDIRRAFGRMGFDDRESVSLIGGGHAFGKCHTNTSGFEGAWTLRPTTWSNDYFNNLFTKDWTTVEAPNGELQWEPTDGDDIIMLTADLALGPEGQDADYIAISDEYSKDINVLTKDFAAAWYRLTTQDMGPITRCLGDMVPEAQPFQHALPSAPETLPNYVPVRTKLATIIDASNADDFINLAYRCASTYRVTDHSGGCNGARIRFEPESTWESNTGTPEAIMKLQPVKDAFSDVSYADIIVLAGIVALETENEDLDLPFCGGYVDAEDGAASAALAPRVYKTPVITIRDDFVVKGLTPEEGVALASRLNVGSQYFTSLRDSDGTFTDLEKAMNEEEFEAIVASFADDEEKLISTFKTAWTKLMTSDRYLNYRENACSGVKTQTLATEASPQDKEKDTSSIGSAIVAFSLLSTLIMALVL